jgi:3-oxoacyl-[acyl-carrier protein] reductase
VLLENRTALVTGAGSGIGRAIARGLAGEGARVGVFDRDGARAAETCRLLAEDGHPALPLEGDVRREDDLQAAVGAVAAAWGGLDILVNNAGVSPAGLVRSHDTAEWRLAFDVNVRGTLFLTRAALPWLSRSAHGRVINISSEIAQHGMMYQAAYAASKGGVSALTKGLARLLGPHGGTANAICPGVVPETSLVREFTQERPEYAAILEFYRTVCPQPRQTRASDIAGVAVMLASDYGAFVSGQLITVNGGSS